jgi:hypothetical protein
MRHDIVANVANNLPQQYKYIKNVTLVTDHEQNDLSVMFKALEKYYFN